MNKTEVSILIVDDDCGVRNLLTALLEEKYNCVTAVSAEEAIRLLESSAFSLVLTDIKMPGAWGFDLCELVREKYPDTRVVVMSAASDMQYIIEALRRGAVDYLLKPFDILRVLASIKGALTCEPLLQMT